MWCSTAARAGQARPRHRRGGADLGLPHGPIRHGPVRPRGQGGHRQGNRGPAIRESCRENVAVCFSAIGGISATLFSCIKSATLVCYEDLKTEAVQRLEIENFPLLVTNDAHGRDMYDEEVKNTGSCSTLEVTARGGWRPRPGPPAPAFPEPALRYTELANTLVKRITEGANTKSATSFPTNWRWPPNSEQPQHGARRARYRRRAGPGDAQTPLRHGSVFAHHQQPITPSRSTPSRTWSITPTTRTPDPGGQPGGGRRGRWPRRSNASPARPGCACACCASEGRGPYAAMLERRLYAARTWGSASSARSRTVRGLLCRIIEEQGRHRGGRHQAEHRRHRHRRRDKPTGWA